MLNQADITMRHSREQTLVDRLRKRSRIGAGSFIALGIGDDCCIYRPRGSKEDLLFTCDLCIENVHFRLETHKPAEIAAVAIGRSISDVAAMGGLPRFSLASVSIGNAKFSPVRLLDALADCATRLGAPLAGGDLARSDRTFCDITVCGAVPRGTALRRDGARPGDEIWVSGALGGSALGLERRSGAAWKRHVSPQPRVELGDFLRAKLRAASCIDISDGLSLDLHRLCLASAVAAVISEPPRFRGATLEQALHGGEEYELLFTVRPGRRVPTLFRGVPLTRIGTIIEGRPGEVRMGGSRLEPLGYDHFSRERVPPGASSDADTGGRTHAC
jgi:thiamine-monophosphate kinase